MKDLLTVKLSDIRAQINNLDIYSDEIDYQVLKGQRNLLTEITRPPTRSRIKFAGKHLI